ncbi:MAG: ABC transporter permease [Clostridiaceae bacterium]|nr:ABC transporter permease [Clostridiaceae bacterium]
MKPLSALNYSKNNRKKLITSTISIIVAVLFLFVFQTFIKSILDTMYQVNTKAYNIHVRIYSVEKDRSITEKIINEIKNDPNVEKIIPFIPYTTRYIIPASMSTTDILGVRAEDMEYFMKRHKITLKEGRLPLEGNKEVALDLRVAKNKKVKLGDKIGNSVIKNDSLDGEYTVVGLLEEKDFISLMPYNTSSTSIKLNETNMLQISALVFPKDNKLSQVDTLVSSFSSSDVSALGLNKINKLFNDNMSILKTLDMICIIAIMVMVISVGSSKYVQFYSRKQEFGVLNALGYTKTLIMKKAFMEILLVNTLGFSIGLAFGVLVSFLFTNVAFTAVGAIGVFFGAKAFLIGLFIPLFTTLFTLIPVNRMINKLDPIVMIEGI